MALAQASSFMVQDELTGEWVLFAPKRTARPHDTFLFAEDDGNPGIPPKEARCHICPSELPPAEFLSVPASGEAPFFAVPNAFPAVGTQPGQPYGHQEVLIEGISHESVKRWSASALADMLGFWAKRMTAAAEDPRIGYVVVFKNEGAAAGASLHHPHSQLWATGFVPPRMQSWQTQWHYLSAYRKRCPFCHEIDDRSGGALVVYEDAYALAYAHPAARFAYEVRIVPKRHVDHLGKTHAAERQSLANALAVCLRFIRGKGAAYNIFTQDLLRDPDQHAELRLVPRLTTWAGVEISSGFYINPVTPEDAAKAYRSA